MEPELVQRLRKRDRRLLVVLAHPDDESYGSAGALARAGEDPDAATVWICLTSGEASSAFADEGLSPTEIRAVRERRVRRVATRLGIDALLLPRLPDGALARQPLFHVGGVIQEVLEALAPQVVITQDARGVNGHPDHIAAHWAVRHAIEATALLSAGQPTPRLAQVVYPPATAELAKPRLLFPTREDEIDVTLVLTEDEIDAKEDCLRIHEALVTLREAPGCELQIRDAVEHYDLLGEAFDPPAGDLFAGL